MTLHDTNLCRGTLHNTTLCRVTLHDTNLCRVTLHDTNLCRVTLHVTNLCRVTLHDTRVTLHDTGRVSCSTSSSLQTARAMPSSCRFSFFFWQGLMVVLRGVAISYERGTPVRRLSSRSWLSCRRAAKLPQMAKLPHVELPTNSSSRVAGSSLLYN